jgi:hypothetical protein
MSGSQPPAPGSVIRYAYLWANEHAAGGRMAARIVPPWYWHWPSASRAAGPRCLSLPSRIRRHAILRTRSPSLPRKRAPRPGRCALLDCDDRGQRLPLAGSGYTPHPWQGARNTDLWPDFASDAAAGRLFIFWQSTEAARPVDRSNALRSSNTSRRARTGCSDGGQTGRCYTEPEVTESGLRRWRFRCGATREAWDPRHPIEHRDRDGRLTSPRWKREGAQLRAD